MACLLAENGLEQRAVDLHRAGHSLRQISALLEAETGVRVSRMGVRTTLRKFGACKTANRAGKKRPTARSLLVKADKPAPVAASLPPSIAEVLPPQASSAELADRIAQCLRGGLPGVYPVLLPRKVARALLHELRADPKDRVLSFDVSKIRLLLSDEVCTGPDDEVVEVYRVLTVPEELAAVRTGVEALRVMQQAERSKATTITVTAANCGNPGLDATTIEACRTMSPSEIADLLQELRAIR